MVLVTEDDRAIIIVEAGNLSAANNSAASWDPDTGGDQTFGSPKLSSDGTEPASHYACNTALTSDMKQDVLDAMDNVPFVEVYFASNGWDWESALADLGLQVIEPEV